MNRQRFNRSLRINLLSISLFLFGHFFGFGPGAARTRYLAPDALLLSAPLLNHYITGTHNTHWCLPPPAPLRSAFTLSLAHAQNTLSLATSPATLCLHSLPVSLDHLHCLCLSEPQLCREAASQRLCGFQRCKGSPTCYTAPSSRLLVPSSPQVRRQSVQMHDHHLCPGCC